jgi:hypothetical protein
MPKIRSVEAVRPIKIVSASPGLGTLGKGLPPDRYAFSFDVAVEFDLTIERLLGWLGVDRRMVPLGRAVNVDELSPPWSPFGKAEPERITIACDVSIEASVRAEGAKDGSYTDLVMTEAWPWRTRRPGDTEGLTKGGTR